MNILVLTNMYPYEKDNNPDITKVVAYFAREWVKQGHRVVAIINSSAFPKIYYTIGKYMQKFISEHYCIAAAPNPIWTKKFEFDDTGVKVVNMPMQKIIPKGKYIGIQFKNQENKIISKLKELDFVPDVITGHWANPQVKLVSDLAKYYDAKSALVLHSDHTKALCERYKVNDYMDSIGRFGFRSKTAAEIASGHLDFKREPFICYSGLPDRFLSYSIDVDEKNFNWDKLSLITAGRLIECKNINSVIEAADKVLKDIDFEYIVAGDGPLMAPLKEQAKNCGLDDKICFTGQIDRDELQKRMAQSGIYVMISHDTFGLVYIEAMLQGCIVIASRYGGIDGVIVDGENGFLCEEGNADELAEVFQKILNLSIEEKKRIAKNAIETAQHFSESEMSKKYLDDITK
ncbi:MAG: glycosyltransferase family 4 protein [Clostridia bacterium]|nr:glycosyltransferase family 4 protein [Clostridia bacterium]